MRKIIEILSVERKKLVKSAQKNNDYWKTTALLDNQEEASGYGKDFEVGDEVEAWWDEDYDQYKMQKRKQRH